MAVSATAELFDVDLSGVEDAVGSRSFDRGRIYARRGRVLEVRWDSQDETLAGSVAGQRGLYETGAFFVGGRDGALQFEDGECTCPVGYNCKHVAALVIAATESRVAARSLRLVPSPAAPPAWEQPLRALLDEEPEAARGA